MVEEKINPTLSVSGEIDLTEEEYREFRELPEDELFARARLLLDRARSEATYIWGPVEAEEMEKDPTGKWICSACGFMNYCPSFERVPLPHIAPKAEKAVCPKCASDQIVDADDPQIAEAPGA